MADVFMERRFDPPVTVTGLMEQFTSANNCFEMHRIEWQVSLLSTDGQRSVCRFSCPDEESLRLAVRQAGARADSIWSGTVHLPPDVVPAEQQAANVVVARHFEEPVALESVQAIEDAGAWCLEAYKVRFLRTFFSLDRKRMICLYCAPDAESVRLAQRQAGMPMDRVWAFRQIRAETGNPAFG